MSLPDFRRSLTAATSEESDSAASRHAILHRNTVRDLLLAAALTIALYFIPYAGMVTYPLRLLVTFIHEGFHALAALLTGGVPISMAIQPDASGLTKSFGGFGPIIASAGYLGATFYGAALIASLRRGVPARILLIVTGVLVGLETVILVRPLPNVFGFLWGAALTVALVAAGLKLPAKVAAWTAGFVGLQCVMNALFDLQTLFGLSIASSVPTDAQNMQRMTFIPAAVWSVLWIVTALGMLWVVLAPAFRAGRRAR